MNNSPPLLAYLLSVLHAVNNNPLESSFTPSERSPLSAPVAKTPENRDFHADYIALKHFFLNENCVLRNKVIPNKPYDDQVLVDANISSQTGKLHTKTELLAKENMELNRIVTNQEIIRRKLSSNKN